MKPQTYPVAIDPELVGTYPAEAFAGGGYVWDDVLKYRVWCHPEDGSDDYYYPFATYAEALELSLRTDGAEEPLALLRQAEYIDEPEDGEYIHIRDERITEWPVELLHRPRRNADHPELLRSQRAGESTRDPARHRDVAAGYFFVQRSSQARTCSCHSLLFCGLRTQWFSSGKWMNFDGMPLRWRAVKVDMPWVSTTR